MGVKAFIILDSRRGFHPAPNEEDSSNPELLGINLKKRGDSYRVCRVASVVVGTVNASIGSWFFPLLVSYYCLFSSIRPFLKKRGAML